jgi:hypothetical protein
VMKTAIKDPENKLARVNVAAAMLPFNYIAARMAIQKCENIDEAKAIGDKMAALATYAKQAGDHSMELAAKRIRLRAVRRCGELLLTFDGAAKKSITGEKNRGDRRSRRTEEGQKAGMTVRQIEVAGALAKVSLPLFEKEVEGPKPRDPKNFVNPKKTFDWGMSASPLMNSTLINLHLRWAADKGTVAGCRSAFLAVVVELGIPIMRARLEAKS